MATKGNLGTAKAHATMTAAAALVLIIRRAAALNTARRQEEPAQKDGKANPAHLPKGAVDSFVHQKYFRFPRGETLPGAWRALVEAGDVENVTMVADTDDNGAPVLNAKGEKVMVPSVSWVTLCREASDEGLIIQAGAKGGFRVAVAEDVPERERGQRGAGGPSLREALGLA